MKKHPLDISIYILSRVVGVFLLVFCFLNIYLEIHAEDLLEQAFAPAKTYNTVTNLGNTKNAVGNEVFRTATTTQDGLIPGQGCFINGTRISTSEIEDQITTTNSSLQADQFCQQVLGGDWNVGVLSTQEPLLIRITKWLLRITIVLSISMVIYNGVGYIIESAKGGEVKDATKNIMLIVGGILLALFSLVIINLLRSVSLSSLGLGG